MTTALRPYQNQQSHSNLLNQFRREFDRMFDRMFDDNQEGLTWTGPALDVAETENEYEVHVEVPGVNPDEIDVELRHGDLWITGQRKHYDETEGKTWHRVESRFGQFRRMVRLGEDVDPEKVEARYEDGILVVSVPKTETARPRKIAVKR